MTIKGEPKIVDKHIMNNKRYALTVDSEKSVKLWQLDLLEKVMDFPN
jgi:hypothetical protein